MPRSFALVILLVSSPAVEAQAPAAAFVDGARGTLPGATDAPTAADPAPAGQARTTDELLQKARAQYEALEYDLVIPLAEEILSREGTPIEQQLDAYLLQGSALAIVGDPIDAEKPFRLLLRGRPDFDLPPETPPKILAVFRKVQVEEKAIAEQLRELARARILKDLELRGAWPTSAEGGYPLIFRYSVRDPTGAVDSFRVRYRRAGDAEFSELPLKRDDEGQFVGAIPGDWTASDDGFVLEYILETADGGGSLLVVGSESEPLRAEVSAGSAERAAPPPVPLWGWGVAAAGAGLATTVSGGAAAGAAYAQWDYTSYAERGRSEAIDGPVLVQKGQLGTAAFAAMYATLAASVIAWSGVGVLALFTNWTGEEEAEL